MIINHNMNAMNAHRNMATNTVTAGKSMEKLSSGLRINRAGDDAAGLSISEKMRGQIRGLEQASRNSQDGISLIQTTEGALNETHSILQRMRELSVQASNDTNTSEDKGQLSKEIKQLTDEIDRISQQTQFNKMDVLNGNGDEPFKANIQVGANSNQAIEISINKMDVESLLGRAQITGTGDFDDKDKSGTFDVAASATIKFTVDKKEVTVNLTEAKYDSKEEAMRGIANDIAKSDLAGKVTVQLDGSKLVFEGEKLEKIETTNADEIGCGTSDKPVQVKEIDLSSHSAATASITTIDRAIEKVSTQRSQLGAYQNRLEHTIKNVDNAAENLQAAESRVRDVDMANEMMTFSKNNILTQAAQAMLAQANQQPQGVLQLLR